MTTGNLKKLGRRLRHLRQDAELTQEEVAARAGLTGKYISEIEAGRRNLSYEVLLALVEDGLGSHLSDLFAAQTDGFQGVREGPTQIPKNIEIVARDIAALPPTKQTHVLALIRSAIQLAS